jgi:hypothetical protein
MDNNTPTHYNHNQPSRLTLLWSNFPSPVSPHHDNRRLSWPRIYLNFDFGGINADDCC